MLHYVLTTTISGGKIDIIGEKRGGKQETETFVDYFSENLLISVVYHSHLYLFLAVLFSQLVALKVLKLHTAQNSFQIDLIRS